MVLLGFLTLPVGIIHAMKCKAHVQDGVHLEAFIMSASKSHLDTEEHVRCPTPASGLLSSGGDIIRVGKVTLVPYEPLQREDN